MSGLRVAAAGIAASPRNLDEALAIADDRASAARAAGARLLLLPQRFLSDLDGETLEETALLSDAPPLRALGGIARRHGVAIACGYLERCSGRIHDATLFIDAQGCALANYRRTHLDPRSDPSVLAPGHWLNLVRFGESLVGILAGADLDAPEPARALALAGATMLLVPARSEPEDAAIVEALLRARAFENDCGIGFADQGGAGAFIVGPDGTMLAASAGKIAVADLPARRSDAGLRRLAARRPHLYQRLTVPHPAKTPVRS